MPAALGAGPSGRAESRAGHRARRRGGLVTTKAGDFWAAGHRTVGTCIQPWRVRLSASLEVLEEVTIVPVATCAAEYAQWRPTDDGGSVGAFVVNPGGVLVFRLGPDDTVAWARLLGGMPLPNVADVLALSDGRVVVSTFIDWGGAGFVVVSADGSKVLQTFAAEGNWGFGKRTTGLGRLMLVGTDMLMGLSWQASLARLDTKTNTVAAVLAGHSGGVNWPTPLVALEGAAIFGLTNETIATAQTRALARVRADDGFLTPCAPYNVGPQAPSTPVVTFIPASIQVLPMTSKATTPTLSTIVLSSKPVDSCVP